MRPKNRACSMPMASECVETFPAELKQFVASWLRHAGLRPGTAIAQLVAADQAVVAIAIGGDAVEGEPGPPCACQDPPGGGLPQAKEGSRGAGGHGAMLAAAGRPGQVLFWAARQAGAPAGIPSGVAVMRLQGAWLRVWLSCSSAGPTLAARLGQGNKGSSHI